MISFCSDKQFNYRQYGVLVDNEDAQHAETDSLSVHATQKHIYLAHIFQKNVSKLYASTTKYEYVCIRLQSPTYSSATKHLSKSLDRFTKSNFEMFRMQII